MHGRLGRTATVGQTVGFLKWEVMDEKNFNKDFGAAADLCRFNGRLCSSIE